MGRKHYYEAAVVGKWFNGPDALKIGLVDELFKEEEYEEKAH